MPKKELTRAERYKRNYRIIRNKYHDSELAKKAQTWSDETIYQDLGIKVTNRKTPELKKSTKAQKSRGKRNLNKYLYARGFGLSVKQSKKLVPYKKEKIQSTDEYIRVKEKKFTLKNKHKRMDLWSEWSERGRGNMPPAIEKEARDINRSTIVAGKHLDDMDHYGYVVLFYMFVENKTMDEIKDLVSADPHDSMRVIYKTTVRA